MANDSCKPHERLFGPLYQLDGDAFGTLEEPQLSAEVLHLVAEHCYALAMRWAVDSSQARWVRDWISACGNGCCQPME